MYKSSRETYIRMRFDEEKKEKQKKRREEGRKGKVVGEIEIECMK